MIDVILPAGGRISGEFAAETGVGVKALIEIGGRTVLQRTIDALRATGQVVWVRKVPYGDRYNVGMKFTDISAYNKARISTLEDRVLRDNF